MVRGEGPAAEESSSVIPELLTLADTRLADAKLSVQVPQALRALLLASSLQPGSKERRISYYLSNPTAALSGKKVGARSVFEEL